MATFMNPAIPDEVPFTLMENMKHSGYVCSLGGHQVTGRLWQGLKGKGEESGINDLRYVESEITFKTIIFSSKPP